MDVNWGTGAGIKATGRCSYCWYSQPVRCDRSTPPLHRIQPAQIVALVEAAQTRKAPVQISGYGSWIFYLRRLAAAALTFIFGTFHTIWPDVLAVGNWSTPNTSPGGIPGLHTQHLAHNTYITTLAVVVEFG